MHHQRLVWTLLSALVVFSGGEVDAAPTSSRSTGGNYPAMNNRQASPAVMYGPPGFTPGQPLSQHGAAGGSGSGPGCRNTNPDSNKALIRGLYQDVFIDKKFDQVDKYFEPDVTEHNPMIKDGIEGQREALKGPGGLAPFMWSDLKRMSAEGDLVWAHFRLPIPSLGISYAAVDIFRIGCQGKIEEHWDVLQDMNVTSVNDHPFF